MKSLYCSIVKNAGGVVNCARLTFCCVHDTIRIEKTERQERKMQLRRMLGIQPGLTAIIGGGGKTTLLYALARELAAYLHCPVAAGELLKEKMICLC